MIPTPILFTYDKGGYQYPEDEEEDETTREECSKEEKDSKKEKENNYHHSRKDSRASSFAAYDFKGHDSYRKPVPAVERDLERDEKKRNDRPQWSQQLSIVSTARTTLVGRRSSRGRSHTAGTRNVGDDDDDLCCDLRDLTFDGSLGLRTAKSSTYTVSSSSTTPSSASGVSKLSKGREGGREGREGSKSSKTGIGGSSSTRTVLHAYSLRFKDPCLELRFLDHWWHSSKAWVYSVLALVTAYIAGWIFLAFLLRDESSLEELDVRYHYAKSDEQTDTAKEKDRRDIILDKEKMHI